MEQKISKLMEFHRNKRCVLAGAIIGSYAKSKYIEGVSDIDLIFIVNEEFDDKEVIKEISSFFMVKEYYDVYSTEIDNVLINFSYHRNDELKELVCKIIECKDTFSVNKPWTVGGVCDDVLMEDIQKAIICFDKNNFITDLQHRIDSCDLSEWYGKMVKSLRKDIAEKRKTILNFYEKCQYKLAYIGLMELGQLEHRLFYAERNAFYPGFKHIYRTNNADLFMYKYLDEEMCEETVRRYWGENNECK